MSTGVIEINDTGIGVFAGDQLLLESPGYAILGEKSLLVGEEAYENARLNPRRVNNRFWDQLNLDPLGTPTIHARHHADLAYAHLAHIWNRAKGELGEVVFAIPSSLDKQQLGLLLGIAQECGIPAVGLVDAAVAACSKASASGTRLLHLDIQLHRAVLTELSQDTVVKRIRVDSLPKIGLARLRETWANALASAFVRTTRLDPRHSARTEQQLYDHLPAWLATFSRLNDAELEIKTDRGQAYALNLTRAWFAQTAQNLYRELDRLVRNRLYPGVSIDVLLSHRLGGLPGFASHIAQASSLQITELESGIAARNTLQQMARIGVPGEPLHLVTHLPVQRCVDAAKGPGTSPAAAPNAPTHLLYRNRAHKIDTHPLMIGTDIPATTLGFNIIAPRNGVSRRHCSICLRAGQAWLDDHSTFGTFLNGDRVHGGTVLHVGDKIGLGTPEEVLTLIAVVD